MYIKARKKDTNEEVIILGFTANQYGQTIIVYVNKQNQLQCSNLHYERENFEVNYNECLKMCSQESQNAEEKN